MNSQKTVVEDFGTTLCPTLRDLLGVLHAEMDVAWNRESVSREQVHRWGCMIREALGSVYTDSQWLKSIGFVEDTNKDYILGGWLVITCEHGKWSSYSVKSSHWHYLCAVDLREDVTRLVAALKLNA
jgi:hypothetical protein